MLPGSIWQTYMSSALRGTPTEQFSRFVALGTPPINDNLDEASDEESEGRSDEDDEDSDRSRDGDSDRDSNRSSNSDRGSDNSGNSSEGSNDDSEG